VRCHSHESGNLLPGKASCKGLCVCFASFHESGNLHLAFIPSRISSSPCVLLASRHSHESGNLLPGKASCKGLCVCFASFHESGNLHLAFIPSRISSSPCVLLASRHSHESGNLLPSRVSCKGLCVCFASFHESGNLYHYRHTITHQD
jgi:hypothetical protein